jgi:hypothetical protein
MYAEKNMAMANLTSTVIAGRTLRATLSMIVAATMIGINVYCFMIALPFIGLAAGYYSGASGARTRLFSSIIGMIPALITFLLSTVACRITHFDGLPEWRIGGLGLNMHILLIPLGLIGGLAARSDRVFFSSAEGERSRD